VEAAFRSVSALGVKIGLQKQKNRLQAVLSRISLVDSGRLDDFQRTVIVAVPVVRVMKVAIHQVTGVVTVGYGFVTASGSVNVSLVVARAGVLRRAGGGVLFRDFNDVMVDCRCAFGVMQVAVVQVVHVVAVLHGSVAAVLPVLVTVVLTGLLIGHG